MSIGRITRSVVLALATPFVAIPLLSCGTTAPARPGALDVDYFTVLGDAQPFIWGVSIDGASPHNVSSADSGSFLLDGLTIGEHHIIISSLPAICTSGSNDRAVTVSNVDTARVQIAVRCRSSKAILKVTTASTGSPLDPDGYVLLVGTSTSELAAANTGSLFLSVSAGSLKLTMKDIEPNCAMTDSVRTITVGPGDTLTVPFVATCGPYPIGTIGA